MAFVRLVMERRPDIVAVFGDLGDQPVNTALKGKLASLTSFESVPGGGFWTPGNHENSAGILEYRNLLSPLVQGSNNSSLRFIKILENSFQTVNVSIIIEDSSSSQNCLFDVAGLADASGENPERLPDKFRRT